MVYITFVFVLFKKRKNKFFRQFIENKLAYFFGTNRDYWGIIKCVILFVEKVKKIFKKFSKILQKNEKKESNLQLRKRKKRELDEREKEKMQNKKSQRNDVLFL